jgi:hypothetical protein
MISPETNIFDLTAGICVPGPAGLGRLEQKRPWVRYKTEIYINSMPRKSKIGLDVEVVGLCASMRSKALGGKASRVKAKLAINEALRDQFEEVAIPT